MERGIVTAVGYAALRAMSDEQLIQEHDEMARITSPSVDYYLAELRHRDLDRQTHVMKRLTWWIALFTLANVVLTGVVVVRTL
jgi:hypothetical protein